MTRYRLGDTICQKIPPVFAPLSPDEGIRRFWEEEMWRNGKAPIPKHIKDETVYIILDTQDKVDAANEGIYD